MRRLAGGLGGAAALAAALALAPLAAARAQGEPLPPGAWAVVDGVAILRTAVEAEAARGGFSPGLALRRLVGAEVMRGRLVAAGVDPAAVSEADVERGLAEAQASLRRAGLPEDRVAELARFRDQLRVPVAFQRHVEALVDAATLGGERPRLLLELFGEARARVLSLSTEGPGGEPAALERARALLARLGPDPTDAAFAALCREASDDPLHALTGGDLDWFRPSDARGAVVEACCARARPGLVPAPVVTRRAVVLVYVVDLRLPSEAEQAALAPRLLEAARARRAQELSARWLAETPVRYAPDAPRE